MRSAVSATVMDSSPTPVTSYRLQQGRSGAGPRSNEDLESLQHQQRSVTDEPNRNETDSYVAAPNLNTTETQTAANTAVIVQVQ